MAEARGNVGGEDARSIIEDSKGRGIAADIVVSATKDHQNSTRAPLGPGGIFHGEWNKDAFEHIGFNAITDAPGTLYVEFSLDPSDDFYRTLRKPWAVSAGRGRFDALVKNPDRWHRIVYENGPQPQTKFALDCYLGNHLYPYAVSERDEPVGFIVTQADVTATRYMVVVDLDDLDNWPHADAGRIDIHEANFSYDKQPNARGAVRLGVVTRIDGQSADVEAVLGQSFNNSDLTKDSRDRTFPYPYRLGQENGKLTRIVSDLTITTTDINTATPLQSAVKDHTVIPAVGDLIGIFEHTGGGTYTAFISGHYRGDISPT